MAHLGRTWPSAPSGQPHSGIQNSLSVIPAQAGIQRGGAWVPVSGHENDGQLRKGLAAGERAFEANDTN